MASWRLGGGLGVFFIVLILFSFCTPLFADSDKPKNYFPPLLLCEKKHNLLVHVTSHGKRDWDWALDGPLLDVQAQPSGYFLVTGGTKKVSLVRKAWKGCRTIWDWSELGDIAPESAVAVDWDGNGNPSLVAAADTPHSRLIMSEGKSKGIKIRWEYKLPSPPMKVQICPDSNNLLVVLKDSTVEEVQYQEDKVVWSMGKADGFKDVCDAARGPWGHTYVAERAEGDILCFDPHKNKVWQTHLPFAPSHSFEVASLSVFKKQGKRMVMAFAHYTGSGSSAQDIVYLLNAETGKVVAWNSKTDKGGYPACLKAVPDLGGSLRKQ